MHLPDTIDPIDLLHENWLKFKKDPDHCPSCGQWRVTLRAMQPYEKMTPLPKYWRWHCLECETQWFNPKYAQNYGVATALLRRNK
jgi:hypothetical protein